MKLYSAYYQGTDPFQIFSSVINTANPNKLKPDGALILWGGEDIATSYYNEMPTRARAYVEPSARDRIEAAMFNTAVQLGMPIIGICRGAQLGCALSGGSLFQHLEGGHHSNHEVKTKDGHVFKTSSCHHQALDLTPLTEDEDFELLAWDKDRITPVYKEYDKFEVTIPEVVHFKKTKFFAIQGHPEWMNPHSPFVKWCADQIKERIL